MDKCKQRAFRLRHQPVASVDVAKLPSETKAFAFSVFKTTFISMRIVCLPLISIGFEHYRDYSENAKRIERGRGRGA